MARHLIMLLVDEPWDGIRTTKEAMEAEVSRMKKDYLFLLKSVSAVMEVPVGINEAPLKDYVDHINDISGEYEVLLDKMDGK